MDGSRLRKIIATGLPALRRRPFARSERGATAIEYALLVSLLAVGIMVGLNTFSDQNRETLACAGDVISDGSAAAGCAADRSGG
ncbi:MAG: Flp family type IVb pilin [Litorimonas sp.]